MKKILIIIMHLEMGGAEKSLVNFLNELHKNDAEIDLLLFKRHGVLMDEVPGWINIIDTPVELAALYSSYPKNIKQLPWWILRVFGTTISKLCSKITNYYYGNIRWRAFYSKFLPNLEMKYDSAVSYISGDALYYLVDKVQATKKVAWIHTDYNAYIRKPEEDRCFFEKLDNIATISERCVNSIVEHHPNIMGKVIHLPNIVSSELIRRKANAYIPDECKIDKWIIVSVGRLEPVKGFDMAIGAAKILKSQNIDFRWFIIGEGSEHENLERLIQENGVVDEVKLLGLQLNPYPYIINSHLVVQSSRFEGKSIAIDEAKILCKPVVSTNYSTVVDQLNANEGIITEMSIDGIAKGIMELIESPDRIKKICAYLENHTYGNAEMVHMYKKYIGFD